MKQKLLSILAILMMAVPHSYAKVYESDLNIGGSLDEEENSATIDGIVIRVNDGTINFMQRNWEGFAGANSFTISTELGETITGIEITCDESGLGGGTGWTDETPGAVWSGSATSVNVGPYFDNVTHIKVTVADATVNVTGITLDKTEASMIVGGETLTLTPTVAPGNATDKTVTWTTSDASVATVADGVVTAVAVGTATITVTTTDGAKTATCAVTVAAPAASTYTVTLKDGTDDATSWTIAPAEATTTGVAAGTEVKATYNGTKKVKSVKAVKKAAPATARTLAEATAEDIGKLIGADGNIYDDAAAATAASTTAVAMIAYVGNDAETSTTYNHGLALALGDVSDTKNWCSQTEATCLGTGHQFDSEAGAKGDMAGIDNTDYLIDHAPAGHAHDAASAARGYNSGTHPAGTSAWFLPSAGQWDKMAAAAGSYANLIANAGLQGGWDAAYWSSTEGGAEYAWFFDSSQGKLDGYSKDEEFRVRACLAF